MQPLAQIRIGLAQHACAGVGLDALDRGFCGEPSHHCFLELVHPAAVVGEHAISLEHIAMFAAVNDVAVLKKLVELRAQRLDRRLEMLQFLRNVVGDVVGDDNARLMQHDVPERDSVRERASGEMQRAAGGGLGAGRRQRRKLAGGDHFGEHHRRRLQRLDLFFGIGAARAVLYDQHAERIACPQYRHAEEGVIAFFAGFRPIGERRVSLRVRQVYCACLTRDQADQTFVRAQHRVVHGIAVEALGGVEFEGGIDAQHVDGANLRHHVGGDQHHDLVKAFLRADRLRHHFAKSA